MKQRSSSSPTFWDRFLPVRGRQHTEIVEGVIRYLQEAGFRNLSVCEGSWVGDRTDDALLVCGYDTMLKRLEVPFVDLQKDKSRLVDCAGMKIRICEEPLSADFLINEGALSDKDDLRTEKYEGVYPKPGEAPVPSDRAV